MTDNEKRLQRAAELIKDFEQEKEPERLRDASVELEDVDLRREHHAPVRHQLRAECLALWLRILRTIDDNLNPAFDPHDVPEMSVMPPRTKGGVQYPPGAPPTVIDDPKAREEYEKAIKENRAKQESYLMQTQLRELNERLPEEVDQFIRNAYTPSGADRDEVRTAIDRNIDSESRRRSLYRSIQQMPQSGH